MGAAKWKEAAESGSAHEKVSSRSSGGGHDHITDRGGAKMTRVDQRGAAADGRWDSTALANSTRENEAQVQADGPEMYGEMLEAN